MEVCGVNYCDFIIWRASELVIIRINRDEAFLTDAIDKATTFFKYGVLPELIAKWYTRPSSFSTDTETSSQALSTTSENNESSSAELWCYCRTGESGTMIGCENKNCPIQWFHIECIKITHIPKGKWYCPECRKDKKSLQS